MTLEISEDLHFLWGSVFMTNEFSLKKSQSLVINRRDLIYS